MLGRKYEIDGALETAEKGVVCVKAKGTWDVL